MGLTPTKSYEDLLGDGLETLLGKGSDSLDDLAAGLSGLRLAGPAGQKWTAELLGAELQRLGAVPAPIRYRPANAQGLVTQPFPPRAETADDLLAMGLANLWYLVARSSDVTDRPLGVKRVGRNLVLWRGEDGGINVIENYCPHRGAPLSMGEIVEGNIMCAYHGVQVTGAGVVAAVPPTPSCPLVGEKAVKSYPCREVAGAIWAYIGDAAHEEAPEPVFPEELISPEWSSFLYVDEWRCNWQTALDNRLDPVHGSFLHAGTFTLAYGRKDTELKIEKTAHGFQTFRTNQKGVNIDWHETEFYADNIYWVRTEIPYPPSFGGGSFMINGFSTPIDRDTTLFWVYRSRKVSGWRGDMWRFLYNNRLEARNFQVVEQDRVLLEAIPLAARQRETLIQTDIAVARVRRHLRLEAERQLRGDASAASAAE